MSAAAAHRLPRRVAGPLAGAVAGVAAGVGGLVARRVLDAAPPGGAARWTRTNHAGTAVTLLEGPALVAALALGAGTGGRGVLAGAALAAGGLGTLDDLAGDARAKGLRGHLGALRRGEVTTGAVKVAGLGLTGLAVAAVAARDRRGSGGTDRPAGAVGAVVDLAVDTVLVAGTANLLNLLDLRPGRALKVAALLALPGAVRGRVPGTVVLGAVAAALPDDLAGRAMMGDAGANALGAVLGAGTALTGRPATRAAAAVAVVTLTLVSERVSFTRVIAVTPPLRALDEWGRSAPPAADPASGPAPS